MFKGDQTETVAIPEMFKHPISTSGVTVRLKVTTAMLKINKASPKPSSSTMETNEGPYSLSWFGICLNDDAKFRNLWY